MQPLVPIDVDPDTGVWQTEGLPMIYVPRHFFNNLHLNVEESIGRDAYAKSLFISGHKSAYYWCDQQAKTLNIDGIACYEHYLNRLSQRGWGQFAFAENQLLDNTRATISVAHSVFVLHNKHFGIDSKQTLCYMFAGWFAGAADWVMREQKIVHSCQEKTCVGNTTDAAHCIFEVIKK